MKVTPWNELSIRAIITNLICEFEIDINPKYVVEFDRKSNINLIPVSKWLADNSIKHYAICTLRVIVFETDSDIALMKLHWSDQIAHL